MFNEPDVKYLKNLYENIFSESIDNSKEFINFVQGDPHSLRIKVEETSKKIEEDIFRLCDHVNGATINPLIHKLSLVTELDTFITNYIENNYV
jgi:hypothetical protein